jgi:hypothetical protein
VAWEQAFWTQKEGREEGGEEGEDEVEWFIKAGHDKRAIFLKKYCDFFSNFKNNTIFLEISEIL